MARRQQVLRRNGSYMRFGGLARQYAIPLSMPRFAAAGHHLAVTYLSLASPQVQRWSGMAGKTKKNLFGRSIFVA
ncbi:hypothetical protein TSA66_09980 [Noviherbaspirillum autotrophicum]|uniref:Uncharacterized protein n=1 Tax=Noviherbaspirillum autotrophicum TaxID=709839 RepID=A0A0C2BIK3_9BURK|nr:hypothetical protein TSA66_09980 [Noviherbaspirillum autotrophicum]